MDIESIRNFTFSRVLSQSSQTGSVYLLGKLENVDAIIHLERTALPTDSAPELIASALDQVKLIFENAPYFSAHAWLTRGPEAIPDITIKVICPATETHIKKYSTQERMVVRETPELYQSVVMPYIDSFPPARIEWIYNILSGKKEADRVLYKDEDPDNGFLILPDLKWDQTSMLALYFTVLVNTRSIRCLRDLTKDHLPLLRDIRSQAGKVAKENFDVDPAKLRMFVHYQPSYYHFHVHVVHIAHEGLAGMTVGQAHLLDDIISLLELSAPAPAPSLLAQMTYTYALGVEHGLYAGLAAGQMKV